MAIVIAGVVTLNRIPGRTNTTTLNDDLSVDRRLTFTGETAKRWHTAAQAKEVERQLHELAWHSRHAGGVHINSDEFDVDDGLYELSGVETSSEVVPFGGATIVRASLTLRRLGGAVTSGANVTRRLRATTTLQTNSYSITSTPRLALPVGATSAESSASALRSSKDGTLGLFAAGPLYTLSGADYNLGECKVFDTGGDATEANWKRVWAPDHSFADPAHIVIENALLRIQPIASGLLSSWRYWVWTGAAYTEITSSTNGDYTHVGGVAVTAAPMSVLFDELGPDRVKVAFRTVHSTSPFFLTKTLTIWRGKPLALVELSVPSSAALLLGFASGGRWVFTEGAPLDGSSDMQRPAFDDGVETGDVTFNAPEDNYVVAFSTKSSSTGTLAIGAWRSSSVAVIGKEGGGFYISLSSTSLAAYLGGVKYDSTQAQAEAEAGTLSGGATVATVIGGASGNSHVVLDALNEQVDFAVTNPPTGSAVVAIFRVAVNSIASASDSISLRIRNSTAGTNAASVGRNAQQFAAVNTWYWQAVVLTGWNGTDTIFPRVVMTDDTGTGSFFIDQVIWLSIAGGAGELFPDDLAAQALTEAVIWQEVGRVVT